MVNRIPKILMVGAALGAAGLAFLGYSRPGYVASPSLLAEIILLEILLVSLWMYREIFFPSLLAVFLLAGMALPFWGIWTGARGLCLCVGALAGAILALTSRRLHFGVLHVIALFAVLAAFAAEPVGLLIALASTLTVTFVALLAAAVLGASMAIAMATSRWARAAIQPWAVALQVTPLPAIAPLIIIWVGDPFTSLVVCATIVAFFPLFANTATGLASPPAELGDLFHLYGAGRWKTLLLLRLPAALPYFLSGLRISGGLALVGAVVAELVAGSGGFASGLAYRMLEASYRLEMPRMFAALVLLAVAGIAIDTGLGAFGRIVLRRWGDA